MKCAFDFHLMKVIEDIKWPDAGFKPNDAAILLVHLVTREQFHTQCLWKDERQAAQKGYGRRARRQFPHRNPSVQKP